MSVVVLFSIILLCPLAAFSIFSLLSLTGRNSPRQDLISTAAMLIAFVCALLLFTTANPENPDHQTLTWLPLESVDFSMGFYFDSVTAVMLLVVTIVSSLVHIFSIGYMHGDPRYPRFFAYLSLFSFSMLFLVVSDNLLGIYIGWELVGLCSYLLIGFWFEKNSAADACKKAFLTTRVGDVGMFIGMMMLFAKFQTLALYGEDGIFAAVAHLDAGDLTWLSIAGVLIFCGAVGKSAQVPLHTWLPDAMEGPTPVSALIHAATMVAAGVYLAARMFPLLTPDSSLAIAYIGGITALLAATIAIVRFDIKRVLAYSTISQLGYMMLAIGAGSYVAGLFHLTTHAFFKALLFLGSGSVIHAFHASHHAHSHNDDHGQPHGSEAQFDSFGIDPAQDMRHMGGLRRKMPVTFVTMLIATLSISGVPYLFSGFWSKDAILVEVLYRAMSWHSVHHYILFCTAALAAVITAFYMFRLIFMTFFGEPRNREMYDHVHESPKVMTVPLIILAILSFPILNTIVNKGFFENYVKTPEQPHVDPPKHARHSQSQGVLYAQAGLSDAYAAEDVHHHEDDHHAAVAHHNPTHDKAHNIVIPLSFVIVILGIGLSALFYYWKKISAEAVAARFRPIYTLFWKKYYFDEFYNGAIVAFTVASSRIFGLFDLRVIDGIVNGIGFTVRELFSRLIGWFDNTFVDGLVNWVAQITLSVGGRIRRVQTGMIQNYLLIILGGLVLLILIFRSL